MNKLIEEQQEPKDLSNNQPDCWKLVIEDMQERRLLGIAKYGMPVVPDNGRDPLIDAYQELLDMAVYLRQSIELVANLREQVKGHCDRIVAQSEIIAKLIPTRGSDLNINTNHPPP
jgi:hypothetical protein